MKNKNRIDEFDYKLMPPADIFAYNELRSCSDLVALYERGILEIQPDYQRNQIWPATNGARFIDSLLKEMPIPSMCFSYDKKQNQMKVIDGLQRMSTLIQFLDKKTEMKLPELNDIDIRLSGKTNIEVLKENPQVIENISNLSLPVTFLRVNHGDKIHNEYVFQIFHRLNTFGKTLNAQEIRNCIYSGDFNSMVKELNYTANWKKILGFNEDKRFNYTELVLRFFAFHEKYKEYESPLTQFLNLYMSENRQVSSKILSDKASLFNSTTEILASKIFTNQSEFKKPSKVVVEALMFGVSKNLNNLKAMPASKMQARYRKLLKDESFSEKEVSEGLMRKDKVSKRFNAAVKIFS